MEEVKPGETVDSPAYREYDHEDSDDDLVNMKQVSYFPLLSTALVMMIERWFFLIPTNS